MGGAGGGSWSYSADADTQLPGVRPRARWRRRRHASPGLALGSWLLRLSCPGHAGPHDSSQGAVAPEEAARVAGALHEMGCYEVSMGDTIGVGTPASVAAMFEVRP